MIAHPPHTNLRGRIVGINQEVPLLDGSLVQYVNLDNAASTPSLVDVMETVNEFMPFYSSVHRGTGFKSRLSTIAYDRAREVIAEFVGADPVTNTVVFGKNTTEAINKLSYRFALPEDAVVVSTAMEHHSNDLPWRSRCQVLHVRAKECGRFDEDHFDALLAEYGERVALVCVSGASNVTGYIQPIYRLARKTHAVDARILVDCAQFAPHRKVDMLADDHPEHLDFVALSAHKMYAPYGTGALIGQTKWFQNTAPEYAGGGTVQIVMQDKVHWADGHDREEAGSPNVVGAVAMAAAAKALMEIGMEEIAAHERELLAYALEELNQIPEVVVYGESDPECAAEDKVGVITFNVKGMSHFKVAAVLGYEHGIGVRSGCFCAHPYVVHLLQLDECETSDWQRELLAGNKTNMPGMVRMSFGCYNDHSDVDRIVAALRKIAAGNVKGKYVVERESGEYLPVDYEEPLDAFFSL